MPGLIAMTSVLIVVGIEMFFATRGAGHIHSSDFDTSHADEAGHGHGKMSSNGTARPGHDRQGSFKHFRQGKLKANGHAGDIALGDMSGSSEHLVTGRSPSVHGDSPTSGGGGKYSDDSQDYDDESDLDLDELDPSVDVSGLLGGSRLRASAEHNGPQSGEYQCPQSSDDYNQHASSRGTHVQLTEEQQQQKMLLQCLLLEAGILFHSVFIGMALSVATGTSFIVLLIAISFHQTFEGLALGSRIAAITTFSSSSPKPWLMALAYGTTTPVGQAIGLLVHNLYDPAGKTGLLMVGVMNAISSGLLLFAGLVELLAEDFLSDKSYETLKGQRRLEACAAVVGGSMLMALVGAWA
ncbi:MAG: hypothetical protein M1827_005493 [Pycnora praestabilis]|nr:MAG: hypothetical protein M1827_005493 [Pycnora praestabilis]